MDKNIQHGRIYRLVYDGMKPGPKPNLLSDPADKLVTYLAHPDGWWRDVFNRPKIAVLGINRLPTFKRSAIKE